MNTLMRRKEKWNMDEVMWLMKTQDVMEHLSSESHCRACVRTLATHNTETFFKFLGLDFGELL